MKMISMGFLFSFLWTLTLHSGDVVDWVGSRKLNQGGDWNESANWSSGSTPTSNKTVALKSGAQVYLSAPVTVKKLFVDSDKGVILTLANQAALKLTGVQEDGSESVIAIDMQGEYGYCGKIFVEGKISASGILRMIDNHSQDGANGDLQFVLSDGGFAAFKGVHICDYSGREKSKVLTLQNQSRLEIAEGLELTSKAAGGSIQINFIAGESSLGHISVGGRLMAQGAVLNVQIPKKLSAGTYPLITVKDTRLWMLEDWHGVFINSNPTKAGVDVGLAIGGHATLQFYDADKDGSANDLQLVIAP